MKQLKLASRTSVIKDHIIVNLRVGFDNSPEIDLATQVKQLVDEISFGGSRRFSREESTARETLCVKTLHFSEDHLEDNEERCCVITLAIPTSFATPKEGIPLLMAVIGYASVYAFVREFQVLDIELPDSYLRKFPGPKYGSQGILTHDEDVPVLGMILKPRCIVNKRIAKQLLSAIAHSGFDYVIDDELTVNPPSWPFEERVAFVVQHLRTIEKNTGKRISYIANITGSHRTSLNLANKAATLGVDGVMLNTVMMGYDTLHTLARRKNFSPFIVANVIGRGLLSNGPSFRINEHVFCLLARISGADAVYTGPFVGNIKARREQAAHFVKALADPLSSGKILSSYAVLSGGISIRNILDNWEAYQEPAMVQMGRGLCELIDKEISAKVISKVVHTLFDEYQSGGISAVEEAILRLSQEDRGMRDAIHLMGW